ncbi:MAG TPA: aldolase/citrate lyase family protein, partial [Spirochaetota bacterium]
MTDAEKSLITMLSSLAADFAVTGIKAEFETEGTRIEELRRLKEISRRANVGLTLKIGGASSLRDLYDARAVGVNKIVAPMVETSAALEKYLSHVSSCFSDDEKNSMKYLINMETVTCARNFADMFSVRNISLFGGIVVGRTDLTGSMGLAGSDAVNADDVYRITYDVASTAKSRGLDVVVGGKVTVKSIPFLASLVSENLLDRFETRKVVFDARKALDGDLAAGITRALEFELAWMKYKREYYLSIANEDMKRILDLEKRMNLT